MVQLNLRELAGLCHCQGIIRLLSFTICQANWLRKCCVLSLHFHSVALWQGLNIEAASVLTQYCIRNIYRVKCRHAAKGNKAIPLSLLHRWRSAGSMLAGATPVCYFYVFCQLLFFHWIFSDHFCIHQTFFLQDRRGASGNNGLSFPGSTIITVWCKCQVQAGCDAVNWYFNALPVTP